MGDNTASCCVEDGVIGDGDGDGEAIGASSFCSALMMVLNLTTCEM